jgi:hypothetical protein
MLCCIVFSHPSQIPPDIPASFLRLVSLLSSAAIVAELIPHVVALINVSIDISCKSRDVIPILGIFYEHSRRIPPLSRSCRVGHLIKPTIGHPRFRAP